MIKEKNRFRSSVNVALRIDLSMEMGMNYMCPENTGYLNCEKISSSLTLWTFLQWTECHWALITVT